MPNEIVKIRGIRFVDCKQQAEVLVAKLKKGTNDANGVISFRKYMAKNI